MSEIAGLIMFIIGIACWSVGWFCAWFAGAFRYSRKKQFNRETFITLYNKRLFTAQQVADLIELKMRDK